MPNAVDGYENIFWCSAPQCKRIGCFAYVCLIQHIPVVVSNKNSVGGCVVDDDCMTLYYDIVKLMYHRKECRLFIPLKVTREWQTSCTHVYNVCRRGWPASYYNIVNPTSHAWLQSFMECFHWHSIDPVQPLQFTIVVRSNAPKGFLDLACMPPSTPPVSRILWSDTVMYACISKGAYWNGTYSMHARTRIILMVWPPIRLIRYWYGFQCNLL